jgi:hypothetical protein
MSDGADESKAPLQPNLSAHDLNDDLAGASILTLLQSSAQMAEGNSQYAGDIAKAELETEVRVYRDRSEQ